MGAGDTEEIISWGMAKRRMKLRKKLEPKHNVNQNTV